VLYLITKSVYTGNTTASASVIPKPSRETPRRPIVIQQDL
jgi:hypothetical protein